MYWVGPGGGRVGEGWGTQEKRVVKGMKDSINTKKTETTMLKTRGQMSKFKYKTHVMFEKVLRRRPVETDLLFWY